ncbi:MAG: 1-deoxy-D-xylulose-5-phosphate synthase [Clostridia bacterium]|nr:1-deoxy-D-xylulose-5-phosphate synthase [Clostridia bacterium]
MLETIKSRQDLKSLSMEQLNILCQEIRQKLISTVTNNGGHLASNLGVVELTVALEYVFDDKDKIVWDVGHQSYVHKLLCGRFQNFDTLRQKNGVCGFPDVEESSTDAFNTGHASTSISAGLGIACARDVKGEDFNVIAVVGDGALTGGQTYEALNNIQGTKMFIVFNDNEMSIGKNVGSATRNLSKTRVGAYDKRKVKLEKFLNKIPYFGPHLFNFIKKVLRAHKLKVLHNLYFDNFDLKYLGPIDGHDLRDLIFYFEGLKNNVLKSTVLHVRTKKGKGYQPAEENPENWHKYLPSTKDNLPVSANVVGETLVSCAQQNEKVVAITAAMGHSVGLNEFQKQFPKRFFDVGIAEAHATTFSAGLASQGLKPYFVVYSTFLQRGYDQILHDVATQDLPVTFLIDNSGFVGGDGQTHQGLFDLSYLGNIPNLTVLSASSENQLKEMLEFSLSYNKPLAIRYTKNVLAKHLPFEKDLSWTVVQKGKKVAVLAVGAVMLEQSIKAFENDENVEIISATSIKPLDEKYLATLSDKIVVTCEDNVLNGGFGNRVKSKVNNKVYTLGVDDKFVRHASVFEQLQENGLDSQSLREFVEKLL